MSYFFYSPHFPSTSYRIKYQSISPIYIKGQLVGSESYNTLTKINYEYGEKISQGKIRNRGLEYLESEFPNLDYIESCDIIAENLPWKYQPHTN